MQVKVTPGFGHTIDVILSNGVLREGDTMVACGMDGPVVSPIKALLMPQPLRELRVKSQYTNCREVMAAQGIKISAKNLENIVAGTQLYVAHDEDEVEALKVRHY